MEEIAHAFASDRRLDLLESLLGAAGGRSTQRQLRRSLAIPASRKGTLNKDIAALGRAGLLSRDGDSAVLLHPALTARALQALSELHREVTAERARNSEERARRMRTITMRAGPEEVA